MWCRDCINSERLFYEVQDVMDGRKRQQGTKILSPDELPLRGFLLCSRCTRVLTGSASKGRNQYYYYYHCSTKCGCRYKAEEVNEVFFDEIKRFIPKPGIAEVCKEVILDVYNSDFAAKGDGRKEVLDQIEALSKRQKNARELLLKGDLDGGEYKEIKKECEAKINGLEAKISDFSMNQLSIEDDLDKAVHALSSLSGITSLNNGKISRELIGSMYPEKFTFENLKDRTARLNEVASIMYQVSSNLEGKKRRASSDFSDLPCWVRPPGLEPGTKRL